VLLGYNETIRRTEVEGGFLISGAVLTMLPSAGVGAEAVVYPLGDAIVSGRQVEGAGRVRS
jgi:hypothetical protein